MHFKYAFKELAEGKSPEDQAWVVHSSETSYHRLLVPIPRQYSESQKEKILNICLNADIHSISKNCKFPDWLGYLGLVLEHMHSGSKIYKSVSVKWASQLKELVPEHSQIYSRLCEIAENDDKLLNIKNLEACEIEML